MRVKNGVALRINRIGVCHNSVFLLIGLENIIWKKV